MKLHTLFLFLLLLANPAAAGDIPAVRPTPSGRLEKKLHRALEKSDEAAIRKVIRKKLKLYNRALISGSDFQRSEKATVKLVNWLSIQPGLSKVVADTCGMHIAIWPGWSDFVLLSDKSTGYAQYALSVQHGRARRFFCFTRTSNASVLLRLQRDDGRMLKSFERACEVEKDNDRRNENDHKVRIYAEAGDLSYSSEDVDAPGFKHSEKNVLRVKLKVMNMSVDTLHLLWPIHQNTGRKVIRTTLQNKYYQPLYKDTDSLNLTITDAQKPIDTLILAPGQEFEQWHTINDILLSDADVQSDHTFRQLEPGKYRLRIVYHPFPAGENSGKCWKPSLDSTDLSISYMWQFPGLTSSDTFGVQGIVVRGATAFETQYGIGGEAIGLIQVTQSSRPDLAAVGDTIAWKLNPLHNTLAGMPVDRSPFQTPGNTISMELDGNLAKEVLRLPVRGISLFALRRGMRSVRLIR